MGRTHILVDFFLSKWFPAQLHLVRFTAVGLANTLVRSVNTVIQNVGNKVKQGS